MCQCTCSVAAVLRLLGLATTCRWGHRGLGVLNSLSNPRTQTNPALYFSQKHQIVLGHITVYAFCKLLDEKRKKDVPSISCIHRIEQMDRMIGTSPEALLYFFCC
jgi:hypothetical protein